MLASALVLLAATHTRAQVPIPGQGSNVPSRQDATRVPVFDFYSGFWFNLHHFLYQQARLRNQASVGTSTDAGTTAEPPGPALTADEQKAWDAALDYYAVSMAKRDLLFDGDMVNIKNRLAELENAADLKLSGLRPQLTESLELAAPVYRARWWDAQDRANREWAAAVTPLMARMGKPLATQLSSIYQESWPGQHVRVDLAGYAGRAGSYTTLDPLRVSISSTDARNQKEAAVELLFHEASHILARRVAAAIARECRARNKPIPRELWRALLFYTTADLAKGSYTPYATRQGLSERGWQNYQRLLQAHWQPYLDGKIDMEAAIIRLVSAL